MADQKQTERYWAEQAAFKLGQRWHLEDRLQPDFLVTGPGGQFGLEVTECHRGPITKQGSQLRRQEQANHEWLALIRIMVERETGLNLHLRYYGIATDRARAEIVAAIFGAVRSAGGVLKVDHRFEDGRVWAFETHAASWNFASDWGCDFSTDGAEVQRAIDAKVKKLAAYRQACRDVRLLVMAFRMYGSGKIELTDNFNPNLQGFNALYFFSYPSSVRIFSR